MINDYTKPNFDYLVKIFHSHTFFFVEGLFDQSPINTIEPKHTFN